jgi:glycine cleavage system transcriptional repressor
MAEDILFVATGSDRPGIMDELSQFLLNCGGNIIDSSTALLRGQYALLLLVRGADDTADRIRQGLSTLESAGIHGKLHTPTAATATEEAAYPFIFVATGRDQAGVLQRISHLMRVLNVNISHMQTRVSKNQSFEIRMELAVPRETPVTMLREYLTYLCTELGITGELKEA